MSMAGIKQRVLVVDDEPSIVDAVATSLRYEGFEVDEATSGRSALASAQAKAPDMIVLDIMLPDLDGLEVTRRLRADGIRVPILFLTARDALEDKIAGLTVGGDDYVTKPFSLAEIVARIHAILRRHGRRGGPGQPPAVRRHRDGRGLARGVAGGPAGPADRHRVQPAPLLPSQPSPSAVEVADPRPRVALRLRGRRQHRRDVRELPAQEARRGRAAP